MGFWTWSPPVHDKALAYLSEHNVMTLATIGAQGLWAAAVFYVNDGFTLYFLSSPASRHGLNIESQSTVAATVQEDYQDWREIKGIQLEGPARLIEGEEQAAAVVRYGAKFPIVANLAQAPAEIIQAMTHIAWYTVTPTRLYFIDNALGLGHREEIPLD